MTENILLCDCQFTPAQDIVMQGVHAMSVAASDRSIRLKYHELWGTWNNISSRAD